MLLPAASSSQMRFAPVDLLRQIRSTRPSPFMSPRVHGFCVIVNVCPAAVMVPTRCEVLRFAETLYVMFAFPLPLAPPVMLIQPALLTAVHAHDAVTPMMLPVAAGGVCVRFVGASVPEQFAAAVMGMVTVSVAPHALAAVSVICSVTLPVAPAVNVTLLLFVTEVIVPFVICQRYVAPATAVMEATLPREFATTDAGFVTAESAGVMTSSRAFMLSTI